MYFIFLLQLHMKSQISGWMSQDSNNRTLLTNEILKYGFFLNMIVVFRNVDEDVGFKVEVERKDRIKLNFVIKL